MNSSTIKKNKKNNYIIGSLHIKIILKGLTMDMQHENKKLTQSSTHNPLKCMKGKWMKRLHLSFKFNKYY